MIAGKHARLWSFLSILAASVALGFPLLIRGIPLGHDTLDHLQRYSCVAAQFWQGEVYPRWLARMNSGLGSPALFVYAPLPYFAPALLRPLLRLPVNASRESLELGISIWLAIALSGVAAYLWLRTMASRWAATAAAILYMAMPYHVVIDAYTRAAVAEMWPFVWMPLSLYFLSQILEGGFALAGAGLAVSYALLILSHLMIALIFTPVLLAAVFFVPSQHGGWQALKAASPWLLLGMGLSSAYWLPALVHATNVSQKRLDALDPRYRYDGHFAFAWRAWAGHSGNDLFLWKTSWVGASTLAAAICGFLLTGKASALRTRRIFWLVAALASFAMMLPFSNFLWKIIPVLPMIQFPWRFSSVLAVAAAPLLAMAADIVLESWPKSYRIGRVAGFAGIAAITLVWAATDFKGMVSTPRFTPDMSLKFGDTLLLAWAKWSDFPYLTPTGFAELSQRAAVGGRWQGSVSVRAWKPRDIEFTSDIQGGEWLTVRRLYYPGWIARTGEGRDLHVEPAPGTGLIAVEAPPGEHIVHLTMPWNWAEKTGMAVSWASVLIAAMLGWKARLSGSLKRD